MNIDRYNAVLAHIEQHPEEWNQSEWRGTACCIAGHAARMFGADPGLATLTAAALALEIDRTVTHFPWLFDADRTMDEFRALRRALATSRLIAAVA
jgi:hypothetical protein